MVAVELRNLACLVDSQFVQKIYRRSWATQLSAPFDPPMFQNLNPSPFFLPSHCSFFPKCVIVIYWNWIERESGQGRHGGEMMGGRRGGALLVMAHSHTHTPVPINLYRFFNLLGFYAPSGHYSCRWGHCIFPPFSPPPPPLSALCLCHIWLDIIFGFTAETLAGDLCRRCATCS